MNRSIVYIVDDDPQVRSYVHGIMRSAGIRSVDCPSAEEFIKRFSPGLASCLILDLRMPGMTGLDLIASMRAQKIDVPIIVLSSHGDIPAVVQSMKLGAAEFLEKPPNPGDLVEKVRRLLQVDTERLAARAQLQQIADKFESLTHREREMVELMVNGLSSKEIAAAVGISIKTVENHRSHVLAKTRAVNVASLVRMKMMVGGSSVFA
jgi:two-component system response regulator FixJ